MRGNCTLHCVALDSHKERRRCLTTAWRQPLAGFPSASNLHTHSLNMPRPTRAIALRSAPLGRGLLCMALPCCHGRVRPARQGATYAVCIGGFTDPSPDMALDSALRGTVLPPPVPGSVTARGLPLAVKVLF